ncbi:hypothetical protein JAN5088_01611 [Jannaschia rubra]|uniref:Uncharacterized protein n=1 Tax=Jannaschia rubra TaxID=282197 RepID=A0A0M6XP21_9RHOB|nr:hypothetical protein JAN5088_01611 [Jannaschia rubra]
MMIFDSWILNWFVWLNAATILLALVMFVAGALRKPR